MNIHNVNLNIHYSVLTEVWDKLQKIYIEMPYWKGDLDGCPRWESEEGYCIEASMEPSGLQFFAEMPEDRWKAWIAHFKEKATAALGYEVGEPEDGFEFRYYE